MVKRRTIWLGSDKNNGISLAIVVSAAISPCYQHARPELMHALDCHNVTLNDKNTNHYNSRTATPDEPVRTEIWRSVALRSCQSSWTCHEGEIRAMRG